MNFSCEADALQEAIRIILRLAPPISGNVVVESTGKKVFIHSNSETSRCSINIPAEAEKPGTFALAIAALRDATKGRKTLSVVYSKTLCKITSGAYSCELATVDALEPDNSDDEKIGKPVKLDADQITWLRQALSNVMLKPTALLATYMPVSIKLTEKGAFVACYDTNHMAFIGSNEITGDMNVKLPIDMLASVLDAFQKTTFKLETSVSNLYVTNQLVKVVLSLPQVEDNELTIEEVIEAAKGTKNAKGQEIEIDKDALVAFLDNARAVATKERSELKIDIDVGKLRFDVTTANGSIKAVVKASSTKKGMALIDFEFMDEAVRKSGPAVIFKFVNDEFLAFKLKEGSLVVSLNQAQ